VNVKIITRLSLNDVLQKVSDFEICQFANDNGWKIGLIENLHAKIYLFDRYRLLIGSNNLTTKGIGLKTTGNEELSIFFKPNTESIKTIDNILLKTHWLNQEKIELMADYLKNNKVRPLSVHYRLWPKEIYNDERKYFALQLSNFPALSPEQFIRGEKPIFLAYTKDKNILKDTFLNCSVYEWLVNKLIKNSSEGSFGWLTHEIHNALIDDPLPHRSTVKEICHYLFEWVEQFSPTIDIIKHRRSKSMKLLI
jgi:hypothetical protein